MAQVRHAAAIWGIGGTMVHSNPSICREYLAQQKEELEALKTENEKLKSLQG